MKSLVVGYGSIGNRHARILKELGCTVGVLSHRQIDFDRSYDSLETALNDLAPEYVVIANRTSEHHATLCALQKAGFTGTVMVEKPLFSGMEQFNATSFKNVFVGYNLRFHPLIQKLRALLATEKIYSVQVTAGKNLAEWRPGSDYRQSYSAIQDQGGGVLRDLSHELDYLHWLLGGWKEVAAVGGHFSSLEINTDDVFCLLLRTPRCEAVQVQMNYLDKVGRREILINGENATIQVDLFNGWLGINGQRETQAVERDFTYREEHRAVLCGDPSSLCSYPEGLKIVRLIESAEKAAQQKVWVKS